MSKGAAKKNRDAKKLLGPAFALLTALDNNIDNDATANHPVLTDAVVPYECDPAAPALPLAACPYDICKHLDANRDTNSALETLPAFTRHMPLQLPRSGDTDVAPFSAKLMESVFTKDHMFSGEQYKTFTESFGVFAHDASHIETSHHWEPEVSYHVPCGKLCRKDTPEDIIRFAEVLDARLQAFTKTVAPDNKAAKVHIAGVLLTCESLAAGNDTGLPDKHQFVTIATALGKWYRFPPQTRYALYEFAPGFEVGVSFVRV